MNDIRKPVVAGFFYPANPNQLKSQIDNYLNLTNYNIDLQNIFGLVVPHAGIAYSGKTAGYAYKLLQNTDYKTFIIISPSHREYFSGISICKSDGFETPLGTVPVNTDLSEIITSQSELIFISSQGHRQEHAIEVQLPFLQEAKEDFDIVPIVMGDQSQLYVEELSSILAEVVDDKTVIIASSDLSHYHSKHEAYSLDSIVEKRIIDFDYKRFQSDLENNICEACGGGPILAMLKAAALRDRKKSIILNRSDSGDTSGDYAEVVGYISAAIYGDF